MKWFALVIVGLSLFSCGVKIPYTKEVKENYGLKDEDMKKVQFFTSSTIILQRKNSVENKGTGDDGTLISNENSNENRIIIPVNTRCVFEKEGENGQLYVRFEVGQNKYIPFAVRKTHSDNRFYLEAKWEPNKGGEMDYGNLTYYATGESGSSYLLVKIKKLKKTRRKDRIVKGMKV